MGSVVATGRRINLGQYVGTAQWANGNCLRRFPVADDADMSCPDGSRMPDGFLSDACVVVAPPAEGRPYARVVSAHASQYMVSVSLATSAGPCVCTVHAGEFEPWRPYRLVPVGGARVCGSVSFGDVLSGEPRTWAPAGCVLSGSAVVPMPTGLLTRFVDDRNGESVSGDVPFEVQDDVSLDMDTENWRSSGVDSTVFSMSRPLDGKVVSPCDDPSERPFAGTPVYVKSLNGIKPNANGSIAIVFC